MTFPAFCTVADVRGVLEAEAAAQSRWADGTLSSNIQAASWFLERATRRIFRDEPTLTLKFTTNGEAAVAIPGLRTASSVALSSATLTADTSYWLIPDAQQSGVYTGVQFRPFGSRDDSYLAYPDWFDTNRDSPKWQSRGSRMPNDLVMAGAWGYTEATLPPPVRLAAKFLAAFYTLRPDALLSGARATESGIFDLSQFPIEVSSFVADWRLGRQAVTV